MITTLVVIVLTGACAGTSPGLAADQLRQDLSARLVTEQTAGSQPLGLRCSGGLAARVGAVRDCLVHHGDERVGLRVRTTGTDPLTYTVLPFLPRQVLANRVHTILDREGRQVQACSCAHELLGRRGRTTRCVLDMGGKEHPVEVTVTGVDGLLIDFTFEEA